MIGLQEYELPVVIQEDESGGYVATCPLWKNAYAQGETIEKATTELSQVILALVKVYQEEHLQIPLFFSH